MGKFNLYPEVSTVDPDDTVLVYSQSLGAVRQAKKSKMGTFPKVNTLIELRALDVTTLQDQDLVEMSGYHAAGDGGGGTFRYVAGSVAADNSGTVIQPTSGSGRYLRQYFGAVNPKWFGAKGDRVADDTVPIQYCLDTFQAVTFDYAVYRVSQVIIRLGGQVLDFNGAILEGNASVATASVVDLKSGSNKIKDLAVSAAQSTNYTCGVHWYTNNLNLYYPGKNRIDGLLISSAQIGLVIGALPSQPDPIPAQGTVQAEGVATDAPLSENEVTGLLVSNCPRGVYMRQPNGKITMNSPDINGESLQWSGMAASTTALQLVSDGSELTINGGYLEQVQQNAGGFFQVVGGQLVIQGTVLEAIAPAFIAGSGIVRIYGALNFGFNNVNYVPFMIDDAATGLLQITDTRIVMPEGFYSTGNRPLIKSVSDTSGTYGANPSFQCDFKGVEFRDAPWITGSVGYNPFIYGVRAKFKNCYISSYSGGVMTFKYELDQCTNLLNSSFDRSYAVVSAFPQTGAVTEGGVTFALGGGTAQWGSETAGLPTVVGETFSKSLKLATTTSTHFVSATTAKIFIPNGKPLLLTGFFKTGTTNLPFIIRAKFYKFDDSAASTASQDVVTMQEALASSTWVPLYALVTPPADATKMELFLYVESGAQLHTANLALG